MWKKVAIAAGIGAVIIGSGSAALAATTSSSPTPAATGSTSTGTGTGHSTKSGKHHDRLLRAEHAQWVTRDKKTNTDVTHDEIRGTVTAVSASSITVKATDGVSDTFAVSSTTKVHAKGDTVTSPGTISQVKVGDRAIVIGTGASNFAATRILDRGVPKATS
jgi:uncharacterized NAD(P)/FAD-binding protein YdhS